MQQVQAASLANNLQSFCDKAKLYDPGQEYSKFVKATNSAEEEEKVDGWELMYSWNFFQKKIFTAKFLCGIKCCLFLTLADLADLTLIFSEF